MAESAEAYKIIAQEAQLERSIEGSRFHAYVRHATKSEEVKFCLQQMKMIHPEASHVCWAWVGSGANPDKQSSDAGEPSGSAGRPILNKIKSRKLHNTLVLVVRYFGGKKLGIPGLIDAYGGSADLVLDLAKHKLIEPSKEFTIDYEYDQTAVVEHVLRLHKATTLSSKFEEGCRKTVTVPLKEVDEFLESMTPIAKVS